MPSPVMGGSSGGASSEIGAILASGNGINTQLVAAGATSYGTFTAVGNNTSGPTLSGTEGQRQMLAPVAGVLKNFYVRTSTAQAGGDLVLTVRINGADSGITITIPDGAAAGVFSDTTHTAAVVAEDLISFSAVNASASSSATLAQWSVVIQ